MSCDRIRTKILIFRSGIMVVSPIKMSTHEFIIADFGKLCGITHPSGFLVRIFNKNALILNGIRNLKFSLLKIGIKSSSFLLAQLDGYEAVSFCRLSRVESSNIKLNNILINKPRFVLREILQHSDFFWNC
jgi:hypothetical protein